MPHPSALAGSKAASVRLARGFAAAGFEPLLQTAGNQQFFWVDAEQGARLAEHLGAELMEARDPAGAGRVLARLVTSWAATGADVDEAISFARTLAS